MAASTALEKKYQRVRDEAVEFACGKFATTPERVLVAFSEHDCVVDVFEPDKTVTTRFIFFYEED